MLFQIIANGAAVASVLWMALRSATDMDSRPRPPRRRG